MSLTAADIITIIQAGGSVEICADGSVNIRPAAGKASRAERNRRYYQRQRLKASESDGGASENVLKRLKAENILCPGMLFCGNFASDFLTYQN
ncbi:MAG: hypothetical protein EOP86_16440 [Verrucomicrobiaceae bacterium]|nr:MAG: hypothetical protein EOP86_16440 [Verrucomicrobiaceae bacterium]